MAVNFPASIDPPAWPFECEYENNSIISKFEDGSQQSRRKFTKSRAVQTEIHEEPAEMDAEMAPYSQGTVYNPDEFYITDRVVLGTVF